RDSERKRRDCDRRAPPKEVSKPSVEEATEAIGKLSVSDDSKPSEPSTSSESSASSEPYVSFSFHFIFIIFSYLLSPFLFYNYKDPPALIISIMFVLLFVP